MRPTFEPDASAFRYLRHRLTRRRFSQLDLRLRIELLLLASLMTGFVFWQVRAPFASVAYSSGAVGVLAALGGTWAVLALLATGVVAGRHGYRLSRGAPGPAWLALPATDRVLARHLAWDSSLLAGWIAVPALGVWCGALGLLPWSWAVLLAPPLALLLVGASRLGGWLGGHLARWRVRRSPARGIAAVLAEAGPPIGSRHLPAASWARRPPWLALALKDLRVTSRVAPVRRHLVTALLFWLLSVLAWRLPSPPHMSDLEYVAAFFLALLGSAALGEWLV